MHIPDHMLEKFQKLWKDQFGEEISKEKAYAEGIKVITYVKHFYRPMIEEEVIDFLTKIELNRDKL